MKKIQILNGNALKLIAAFCMLIDHIGFQFSPPGVVIYRIIGRIAFPIFAFMMAEGCRYTKNKKLHFALIFSLATACQIVDYIAEKSLYMGVLVTFSISILLIYVFDYMKSCIFNNSVKVFEKIASILLCLSSVFVAVMLTKVFEIDYGIFGILTPVFVSLTYLHNTPFADSKIAKVIDNNITRVFALAFGLLLITLSPKLIYDGITADYFMFVPCLLLLLYNGKKGKYNLKYFFYIFYPAHLAILGGISLLLHM